MQQTPRTVDSLAELTRPQQTALLEQPLVQHVREGALERRQYELCLWGLRGLHQTIEQAVWASRSEHLVRVRDQCRPRVSLLERDLVTVCGKELHVPAAINRALDGFASGASRGATPARLVGRLFVLEQLAATLGVGAAAVQAALGDGDQCVTHYLGAHVEDAAREARLHEAFAAALVGEVPVQNALEGARETHGQLQTLLDVLTRATLRRAAAS